VLHTHIEAKIHPLDQLIVASFTHCDSFAQKYCYPALSISEPPYIQTKHQDDEPQSGWSTQINKPFLLLRVHFVFFFAITRFGLSTCRSSSIGSGFGILLFGFFLFGFFLFGFFLFGFLLFRFLFFRFLLFGFFLGFRWFRLGFVDDGIAKLFECFSPLS